MFFFSVFPVCLDWNHELLSSEEFLLKETSRTLTGFKLTPDGQSTNDMSGML